MMAGTIYANARDHDRDLAIAARTADRVVEMRGSLL